jgi:hypothetical protein
MHKATELNGLADTQTQCKLQEKPQSLTLTVQVPQGTHNTTQWYGHWIQP